MKKTRLTAHQRRLQAALDELIELCRQRGIDSCKLRQLVRDDRVRCVIIRAYTEEVCRAGLAAQLSFLREAWGHKKLVGELNKIGGVLDAILQATSSSPEEIEDDTGRANIDANGDLRRR